MSSIDEVSRQLGVLAEASRRAEQDRQADRKKLDDIAATITTLSHDVAQDRAIAAQERAVIGGERFDVRQKLERVDERLEKIEPVVTDQVKKIEENAAKTRQEVVELQKFRTHVGTIIVVAGGIASTAAWLVWEVLVTFGRAAIGRLFN